MSPSALVRSQSGITFGSFEGSFGRPVAGGCAGIAWQVNSATRIAQRLIQPTTICSCTASVVSDATTMVLGTQMPWTGPARTFAVANQSFG